MTGPLVVSVVDDDPSVRTSLKFLLSTVGPQAETFDSADSFLGKKLPDVHSCLVLGIRLPGLSGIDFQRELATRNIRIPIVSVFTSNDAVSTEIQLSEDIELLATADDSRGSPEPSQPRRT